MKQTPKVPPVHNAWRQPFEPNGNGLGQQEAKADAYREWGSSSAPLAGPNRATRQALRRVLPENSSFHLPSDHLLPFLHLCDQFPVSLDEK